MAPVTRGILTSMMDGKYRATRHRGECLFFALFFQLVMDEEVDLVPFDPFRAESLLGGNRTCFGSISYS